MITSIAPINSTNSALTDVETTEIFQTRIFPDSYPEQQHENYDKICSGFTTKSIENDFTKLPLYKAFLPMIFSFKLMGLFHIKKTKTSEESMSNIPSASQIYALVVTTGPWLLVVRFLFTFRLIYEIGPKTIFALVQLIWLTQCGCNAISFFQLSHQSNKFQKYITGFNNLEKYGSTFVCPIQVKKYIVIGVGIMWFAAVGNIAFLIYFTFDSDLMNVLITDPVPQSNALSWLMLKCFYVINFIYLSVLWIFPMILELSLCLLLYVEFTSYKRSFRSKLMSSGKFAGSLEIERQRFLEMVRIIRAADRCLSLHHGASFSCEITNFCLLLYSLIYYPSIMENSSTFFAYLFWIFAAIADLALVCISGILVNSAVSMKQFCF